MSESQPLNASEGIEDPAPHKPSNGRFFEGVILGLLLHVAVQPFIAFVLIVAAGLPPKPAALILMSYVGVSQLPYMVPAILDAALLRQRRKTARGLLFVAMATMGLNLIVWRLADAGFCLSCGN